MVNVIPLNDEREHERALTCWCKPSIDEAMSLKRGGREVILIHHAADCRETCEQVTGESLAVNKQRLVEPS